MFFIDYWYFILVIPALILAGYAQYKVSATFNKYQKVKNTKGLTGAQAARQILDLNNLQNIQVVNISGKLTDHYDPKQNVIRLSDSVYGSTSVAAVGVAAHEAGHAIQYGVGYAPIKIRSAIIPVTQFGSQIAPLLIILGFIFFEPLVPIGIILFSAVALFQLITLPVEINASKRALATLDKNAILNKEEVGFAGKVLSAAAFTYVAALITSLASLLRLILIYNNRR